MKTNIYATFNKLTCELNDRTFNAPNHDVAKQIIINSMFNTETGKLIPEMVRNAKNYKVCYLGTYNSETGIYGLTESFETLWEMVDIVKEIQKSETNEKAE